MMRCSQPALRLCLRARHTHGPADTAVARCYLRQQPLSEPRPCAAAAFALQPAASTSRALVSGASSCRSAFTFRCYAAVAGDGEKKVPATFVAPEKVDMSQYPPPKRGVTKDDCVVQFVRSQGAGGQNVNKVNTKADLRFNVAKADFLPQWIKDRLVEQEKNRMNSDGELVVAAQRHRTQKQNYEDALQRLQEMIDEAATPPTGPSDETIKKVKALAVKANNKRLEDKKRESMRKKERNNKSWD